MPFSIFRLQTLTAANIVGFILGTALFAMFLMLTLYMQQVLGFSPLKTGLGYLAVAGTAIIWANVAAAAVTRIGVKSALVFGMSMMTVGLLYFTQVSRRRLVLDGSLPGLPHRRPRNAVRASCPSRSPPSRGRSGRRPVSRRGSSTPRSRSVERSASRSSPRSRSSKTDRRLRDGTRSAGRPDRRVPGRVLGRGGDRLRRRARLDLHDPRTRRAGAGGALG